MLSPDATADSNGHLSKHTAGYDKHQSQSAARKEAENESTLQDALSVVFSNKWWIFSCFLLLLGLSAVYTALMNPEYQADSRILIDTQSAGPQLGMLLGMPADGANNVANEVEIIKSRTIASRVAAEVLDQRYIPGTQQTLPVLRTDSEEEVTRRQVAGRLSSRTRVSPVARGVDLIHIKAVSTAPEEAALIADLYAEEYAQYDREISSRRARESRDFLESAVDSFEVNLKNQESDLQSFLQSQEVVAPDQEAQQLLQRLGTLRQQRFEAELQRGQAQARLRQLQTRLDSIQPGLAEAVTENDAMQYQALQSEITRLRTELQNYYANNPDLRSNPDGRVEDLKRKIANLREQVEGRARNLTRDALSGSGVGIGGPSGGKLARVQELSESILRNKLDLQAARSGLEATDRKLQEYRGELEGIPQQEIVLNRLERSLSTSSSVYEDLQKKLYDARIAEQSEMGKVQIIDKALVPRTPVRPKAPTNLALGGVLGLILGVALAFGRNLTDTKLRSPEQLRRQGHSVLGTVPDMQPVIKSDFDGRDYVHVEGRKYTTRLISLLNPLSPISESYRQLRTNLQFSQPDSEMCVVMVSSASPGEGKSVTSANLAVAMAQSGQRTLYVDTDLRRSTGHKMFGVAREPGVVDLLFEPYASTGDRFATDIENLHVLPAGSSVPNPAEVVGSEKMKELIGHLRSEFDFIVVDTTPILAVTDSLLISEYCDAVVVVHSANETDREAVDRTAETLRRVGAEPTGVVLNRFDPKAAYGSYGYGYGYGGYGYGESYDAVNIDGTDLERVETTLSR